jgi:hypothetical protein
MGIAIDGICPDREPLVSQGEESRAVISDGTHRHVCRFGVRRSAVIYRRCSRYRRRGKAGSKPVAILATVDRGSLIAAGATEQSRNRGAHDRPNAVRSACGLRRGACVLSAKLRYRTCFQASVSALQLTPLSEGNRIGAFSFAWALFGSLQAAPSDLMGSVSAARPGVGGLEARKSLDPLFQISRQNQRRASALFCDEFTARDGLIDLRSTNARQQGRVGNRESDFFSEWNFRRCCYFHRSAPTTNMMHIS